MNNPSGRRNAVVEAEAWLAQTTGTSWGQAAGTLNASEKLERLPKVEAALRQGQLSGPQLNEVASAATPDNEQRLLDASAKQSFKQLKRTCANERAKARSLERDEARHARIHPERCYRSHTDADGAYCFEGRAVGPQRCWRSTTTSSTTPRAAPSPTGTCARCAATATVC